jgi:hypothetical protein
MLDILCIRQPLLPSVPSQTFRIVLQCNITLVRVILYILTTEWTIGKGRENSKIKPTIAVRHSPLSQNIVCVWHLADFTDRKMGWYNGHQRRTYVHIRELLRGTVTVVKRNIRNTFSLLMITNQNLCCERINVSFNCNTYLLWCSGLLNDLSPNLFTQV